MLIGVHEYVWVIKAIGEQAASLLTVWHELRMSECVLVVKAVGRSAGLLLCVWYGLRAFEYAFRAWVDGMKGER
jgi:hypothetical protein